MPVSMCALSLLRTNVDARNLLFLCACTCMYTRVACKCVKRFVVNNRVLFVSISVNRNAMPSRRVDESTPENCDSRIVLGSFKFCFSNFLLSPYPTWQVQINMNVFAMGYVCGRVRVHNSLESK